MTFRVVLGAAFAVATGCGPVIVLGDSDNAVCLGLDCGGGGQSGSAGSAGSSAISGSSGVSGGSAGSSAQAGTGGCQPSVADEVCDGLNEVCEPDPDDAGCPGGCEGSFVDGASYMSCLAAKDFDEAELACQEQGMHLVKIDSEQENATVLSLALDDYVWIGGSNRDDASVYTWLDGTVFYDSGAPVGAVYQNFGDSGPSSDAELRCVQLREQVAGTWSMWRCSGMQSFVCERYAF